MITRTWVGGGTNRSINPADWAPAGVPHPGDNLTMTGGTMNIVRDNLAGDKLTLTGTQTLNLLDASASVDATSAHSPSTTINMSGNDHLTYAAGVGTAATLHLARNASWTGTFNLPPSGPLVPGSELTANGSNHSNFINNGSSSGSAQINLNVLGIGRFSIQFGTLEFAKSVAAGQAVTVGTGGKLLLDDPTQFHGAVTLQAEKSFFNDIVLQNLGSASAYSFRNDLLTIYSGSGTLHPIDTLRLTTDFSSGLAVEKSGSSIFVYGAPSFHLGTPLHQV